MSARSQLLLTLDGQADPSAPYTGEVKAYKRVNKTAIISGILDDQFTDLHEIDNDALAASGTQAIDLQTDLNACGVAMALDDVAMVYIEHKSDSLASEVQVQAAGANGWTNGFGTAAAIKLAPGDFYLLGALTAGNRAVTGANKAIDIVNQDGVNAAGIRVIIWGR